jgi:hypothetical protein
MNKGLSVFLRGFCLVFCLQAWMLYAQDDQGDSSGSSDSSADVTPPAKDDTITWSNDSSFAWTATASSSVTGSMGSGHKFSTTKGDPYYLDPFAKPLKLAIPGNGGKFKVLSGEAGSSVSRITLGKKSTLSNIQLSGIKLVGGGNISTNKVVYLTFANDTLKCSATFAFFYGGKSSETKLFLINCKTENGWDLSDLMEVNSPTGGSIKFKSIQ